MAMAILHEPMKPYAAPTAEVWGGGVQASPHRGRRPARRCCASSVAERTLLEKVRNVTIVGHGISIFVITPDVLSPLMMLAMTAMNAGFPLDGRIPPRVTEALAKGRGGRAELIVLEDMGNRTCTPLTGRRCSLALTSPFRCA